MSQQHDTKASLLQAAKEEFMQYGYQKASLRNICAKAGVTTGALYFFFQNKEDLFEALVGETAQAVKLMILEHTMSEEKEAVHSGINGEEFDIEMSCRVISYYYKHKEQCELIMNKAVGSKYENYVDNLAELMEQHIRKMLKAISGGKNPHPVFNDCTLHWLSRMQAEAFCHVLAHDISEAEALAQIRIVAGFLRGGMIYLMQIAGYTIKN